MSEKSTVNPRLELFRKMHPDTPIWLYPIWNRQQMVRAADKEGSGVFTFDPFPGETRRGDPHIGSHGEYDRWLQKNAVPLVD